MSTKSLPIRDLCRRPGRILDLLDRETDAASLTHYGRPVAVMVDYERYEDLLARLENLTQRMKAQTTDQATITDHTSHLAGLYHEVWDEIDTDAYLQQERDAWEG